MWKFKLEVSKPLDDDILVTPFLTLVWRKDMRGFGIGIIFLFIGFYWRYNDGV